jgi:pimeloyl-ACP methyl ester carboxylesterase
MPTATVGKLEIAYEDQGEGEPIVLIMGLASDRESWSGFDRLLSRSMRVVSFDNRGTGGTTGPHSPYAIHDLANDVVGLLDALDLPSVHVLGVSMGGMVAQEVAISHADRVKSLVLGCTHPGGKLQVLPSQAIIDKLPSLGKSAEQMAVDFLGLIHGKNYLLADPDRYRDRLAFQLNRRVPRRVYLAQLGAILAHDTSGRLGAIRAPTLVISGDEDELVPLGNSMVMADRIDNARLAVLSGVAHAFWIEAPERAAQEVLRFLRAPTL